VVVTVTKMVRVTQTLQRSCVHPYLTKSVKAVHSYVTSSLFDAQQEEGIAYGGGGV